MDTTTWELHFEVPRSDLDRRVIESDLDRLKGHFTEYDMDWVRDDTAYRVMTGTATVLQSVINTMSNYKLLKLTCAIDHEHEWLEIHLEAKLEENDNDLDVKVLNKADQQG